MIRNVLITGGSGLIGRHLGAQLQQKGYAVGVLTRTPKAGAHHRQFHWDPDRALMDAVAIDWADAIIHLAGAGIAEKRWSRSRKQYIVDSRVRAGDLLFNAIKTAGKQLEAFVAASAIGYYGARTTDQIFSEADPPATDFQGQTCQQWEASSLQLDSLGVRTVILRVGVVLAAGGALKKMALPIKLFLGSPLGTGRQYIPWIHIDDVCRIFIRALEDHSLNGTYNAVAPEHVTNREFTQALARALQRPLILPAVPALALKLLLGEMSQVILEGSRISSQKLRDTGFEFLYAELAPALVRLNGRKDQNRSD